MWSLLFYYFFTFFKFLISTCIVIKLNNYLADSTICMVKHLESEYNISCPTFCKTILLTMDMVCFHILSAEKIFLLLICIIKYMVEKLRLKTRCGSYIYYHLIKRETLIFSSLALSVTHRDIHKHTHMYRKLFK